MRKAFLLLVVICSIYSCGKQEKVFDTHVYDMDEGSVVSEKWERGNLSYIGSYDEEGNIIALYLEDENLEIIVNIRKNQIASYLIRSHDYYKYTDINQSGELYSSEEGYPTGLFQLKPKGDTIVIKKIQSLNEDVDFLEKLPVINK